MDSHCIIDGCENPIENRDTKLCASHSLERRKLAREERKVKVVKPVKKVTEKRADELKEYPKLKKQYLEHKMMCEVQLLGCTKSATEIHHCSLSAKNFLNTDTWLGVCPTCHRNLENMSAEERRLKNYLTD